MTKKIYLVGFMGVGKTSIGFRLAKKLHWTVYDLDQVFEEQEKMSINDYIEKYGFSAFRNKETELLHQTEEKTEDMIIITGGGIIEREENRLFLKKQTVIYLRNSFSLIYHRLKRYDDGKRPLFLQSTKEELQKKYQTRLPLYEEVATYTLRQKKKTITEQVQECMIWLKKCEGIL